MWSMLKRKPEPEEPKRRLRAPKVVSDGGPPLVPEEKTGNLSLLQQSLSEQMGCPSGKGQVFIRSLVVMGGTTPPRIALKCPLRRDIGQPAEVFYTHIRDVCCANHESCPAFQAFKQRHVKT